MFDAYEDYALQPALQALPRTCGVLYPGTACVLRLCLVRHLAADWACSIVPRSIQPVCLCVYSLFLRMCTGCGTSQ